MFVKRILISSALILGTGTAMAQDYDGKDFFNKKILPVLQERCFDCHSAKPKKPAARLRLDTKEDMAKGGKSGALLVAGDPEKSLLIEVIRYTTENKDLRMPPERKGGKLADDIIKDFELWVKNGAQDPR